MDIKQILKDLSNYEILFLTLVGEARGEPIEGQIACGNVIMNRAKRANKEIKQVCLAPKQFSCWNDDDPNRNILESIVREIQRGSYNYEPYKQLQWVAAGLMEHRIKDNTKGVLNYMTNNLFNSDDRPKWARVPLTDPFEIGAHTFFTA